MAKLENLKAMLRAREGRSGYEDSAIAIKDAISREERRLAAVEAQQTERDGDATE